MIKKQENSDARNPKYGYEWAEYRNSVRRKLLSAIQTCGSMRAIKLLDGIVEAIDKSCEDKWNCWIDKETSEKRADDLEPIFLVAELIRSTRNSSPQTQKKTEEAIEHTLELARVALKRCLLHPKSNDEEK